jgi:cell wall assembly regulator SMI1
MSTALSVKLLARLEALWVERDAPILSHLRDGLTDVEMDAMTAPIGLRLPDELRIWWSWHDGVDPQPLGPGGPEGDVGVGLSYLSLREAIELYNRARGEFVEDEGEDEVATY